MRSFVRTRYGCDFCKKIGGRKSSMEKHERGCTANPHRVCSMHEVATGGEVEPTVAELKQALAEGGYPKLVEVSHNCPACKLAALRQSEWGEGPEKNTWGASVDDGRDAFDFKAEVKSMWADHNMEQAHGHY